MSSRIAIVTGANKGIGLAIVRGLCKQFDGIVYLTARYFRVLLQVFKRLRNLYSTRIIGYHCHTPAPVKCIRIVQGLLVATDVYYVRGSMS